MDRRACVDVPALPLQLLLRREPDWRVHPVAVVERDEPQGRILWVNERARRARVLPGRRYAEGLSLAAGLRAAVVDPAEIAAAVDELTDALRGFSPVVEPGAAEPGVFLLDASGFRRLFPSLDDWARQVVHGVRARSLYCTVVVGFDRFATYALARGGHGGRGEAPVLVVRNRAEERQRADRVPLARLGLDPRLRDALDRLGVVDVGGLRALPPGGLLARFGPEAHALHELALGRRDTPLVAAPAREPIVERFELDPEDGDLDVAGLVLQIGQRFGRARQELVRRGEALRSLELELSFEKLPARREALRPAEPTLDAEQVVGLVRLRLESIAFAAPVVGFALHVDGVPATRAQLGLFAESPRRDLAAANRALARLRARLGDAAVVRAVLRDGHLPEGRFCFEPLAQLDVPRDLHDGDTTDGGTLGGCRLVRRILTRPRPLTDQRPGPDGWLPGGLAAGPAIALHGPYVISGGWWAGERHREYHFVELRRGDVLWVFFDRVQRRWLLHGTVE
ncbi:MAG: DNA polymerase Y family protein [Planctomycetes bacterium]|nr:DNA polymerase Y family protein [Planctomycetota bacterium]